MMRLVLFLLLFALTLGAQSPDLADKLQQEALTYAQAQSAGFTGSLAIHVLRPPTLPRLPAGDVRFEATHASKQEFTGPFFVSFKIFVDQKFVGTARVDLEGHWVGQLLRARTALARRSVPTEEQLESTPFEGIPPPGAVTEFPDGYQMKIPVAAGHILTREDLQPIPVINAGDPVRLEMVCGPLIVASDAVARSSGGLGEKIRLELPNSKHLMQAFITGPGQARVEWNKAGI